MSQRGGPASAKEIERKALATFGRVKFDSLVGSFRQETRMDDELRGDRIEFVLRSNGLCPSLSEIRDMQKSILAQGGSVNLSRFLQMALECEMLSSASGLSELIEFFSVYDIENSGLVSEHLFRRLMLDCGEKFSDDELEEVINAFSSIKRRGYIDYRAFITTVTGT